MNIDGKILQTLEALQADVQEVKHGQKRLEDGQAHLTTVVEATAAGVKDLQETAAKEADLLDFHADLGKKVKDHEERITELEKAQNIPHPHKH